MEDTRTPTDILLEQFFVAGDFICGVGYGAQLVLWTNCALHLWKTRNTRPYSKILLAYITLLMGLETVYMIAQAHTVQDMYVDNRNYPGGPWVYFLATQYLWENVLFFVTLFVLTFLSDLLVLWRCWVIWTSAGRLKAYAVTFIPALMIIASIPLGVVWTLQSTNANLYETLPRAMGTAYYAVSLSVNIILTVLIVVRILLYRRELRQLLPEEPASHYVSLSAIIIESAALYSFLAFLFIVTYAINHPLNQIFLGSASSAQQIAGYLIIYRLAEGKAWKKNTVIKNPTDLTTIGFVGLAKGVGEKANQHGEMSTFQAMDPKLLSAQSPSTQSSYQSTLGGGSPIVLEGNERGIISREGEKDFEQA